MVEPVTVFRSLHILFAILWAGGAIHFQNLSNQAFAKKGNLLEFLVTGRHGPLLGITALGTVVFGLVTWLINGGEAYSTAGNAVLGTGALGAIIALAVGLLGHLPNSMRARAALEAGDHDAIEGIGRRERLLGRISMTGLLVALVAMVTFRWF